MPIPPWATGSEQGGSHLSAVSAAPMGSVIGTGLGQKLGFVPCGPGGALMSGLGVFHPG